MAILISLLGAIVYGASDFCGGLASRTVSSLAVVVWSQAAGLILLAIVLPLTGGHPIAADFIWGAWCGVAAAIAIALLYRGLAIGKMGIVSPITAILAATIPVIYGVTFRGDHPTLLAYAGIAAALIAVVCVSAQPDEAKETALGLLPPGVPEALISGAGFGAFFIALAQTRPEASMYPLLAARCTSLAVLLAGGLIIGGPKAIRVPRASVPLVFVCGMLDMSANVLYVFAAHIGMLAIVAVITSLYPAATIALAAIVLRERLGRIQWVGVAIALAGVVAISAPQ